MGLNNVARRNMCDENSYRPLIRLCESDLRVDNISSQKRRSTSFLIVLRQTCEDCEALAHMATVINFWADINATMN